MPTSKEHLKTLFGIDSVDEIVKLKSDPVERARPLMPKVKRVQMSAEECEQLCKGIGLEYLEGYEGRVLEYVITDETVDRYGDVVRASGGDFANYKKNPVVLAFHNGKALPVGNALKTWHDEAKSNVRQWVLFLDDRVDRTGMSETAYRFASSGAMKTGSIGFMPKDGGIRRPDDHERKKMRMPSHGVVYESWELLEFSVTPVPANPNASMKDIDEAVRRGLYCSESIIAARGIYSDDELQTAGTLLNKDGEAALEQLVNEPEVNEAAAPESPAAPAPIEHKLTIAPELAELLTTLATRMNVLIEKLDLTATALERNAETFRMFAQASGKDCCAHTEHAAPVGHDSELLDLVRAIEEATAGLGK